MITIIPAIDLIGGKCVRLTKGDYNTEKVYHDDPIEMALNFQDQGATTLHIVDLEAAGGNVDAHYELIKNIIKATNLNVQIGGGIRNKEQVENLLSIGAQKVIVGSKAQTDKASVAEWISSFGGDRIIIGADVSGKMISTHGWQKTSDEHIIDFTSFYVNEGAKEFLCTDIAKDGMLEGPSVDLYMEMIKEFPGTTFIASGGVSTENDIQELISIGMTRIIVGKAIYEGRLSVEALIKKYQ